MLKKLAITVAVLGALAFVVDGSFSSVKALGWGLFIVSVGVGSLLSSLL